MTLVNVGRTLAVRWVLPQNKPFQPIAEVKGKSASKRSDPPIPVGLVSRTLYVTESTGIALMFSSVLHRKVLCNKTKNILFHALTTTYTRIL